MGSISDHATTTGTSVPTDQALAAQKKGISHFAAFAGVYLVLATINGCVALTWANCDCPRQRENLGGFLLVTILLECVFAFAVFIRITPAAEKEENPPFVAGPAPTKMPGSASNRGISASDHRLVVRTPGAASSYNYIGVFCERPEDDKKKKKTPEPGSNNNYYAFAFAGGMVGLELAILAFLFPVAEPNWALASFLVFFLFWLGVGVEMVFGYIE
ncbi:hypothetical protein PG994_002293 [Apiospora phragmitis]|uniref:Uncharacterized protein n=1 Tax=Apiospora phragmitis TaxID=2905665 RepID=A0ABR1WW15_9PEZI